MSDIWLLISCLGLVIVLLFAFEAGCLLLVIECILDLLEDVL